jgi:hypothetical protein
LHSQIRQIIVTSALAFVTESILQARLAPPTVRGDLIKWTIIALIFDCAPPSRARGKTSPRSIFKRSSVRPQEIGL